MRKDFLLHVLFTLLLFALIILFKRWFSLSYWAFFVGGALGMFLPDLDHLIYVWFLRPQDLTSQRVRYLMSERRVGETVGLLHRTQETRERLIFHTMVFQIAFLFLAFFVVTSSASLLGRGLVLAFLLHLLVDEGRDLYYGYGLERWGVGISISSVYWVGNLLAILVLGFVF